MSSPWLLVAAIGITVGALGGLAAALAYTAVVAAANTLTRRLWLLPTVVALVGGLLGFVRAEYSALPDIEAAVVRSEVVEATVASQPQSGPSGPRAVVEIHRVGTGDDDWREVGGRVLVFFGESAGKGIGRGDRVRLRWEVTAPEAQDPGFRSFVRSSGASANAWAFHTTVLERGDAQANHLVRLRDRVTTHLEEIGGDGGALLAGFVTGDDSGLSDTARAAFERTNMSHITAVSGSNVAVLITLWLAVVRRRRFQRAMWAQALLVAGIWGYVVLVGLNPGAVRAGLFATIMLPAARFGRKPDPLTAIMLASAAMLLAQPAFADNVGFWLSMAASAAMVTVVTAEHAASSPWLQGLMALVAAQVATFPITFWAFGAWSPGSLVANLLLGPLVAMLFPIAFLIAALLLVAPWTTGIVGWIPKLGADTIIATVESLADQFPMVRSSLMTPTSMILLAAMSALIIAAMSEDARRWLHRLADVRGLRPSAMSAVVLGAGLGVWLAVAVIALGA